MGYKDPIQGILEACHAIVSNNINDTYLHQAPETTPDIYVIIRPESASGLPKNHSGFFSSVVIAFEIVAKFQVSVNSIMLNHYANIISSVLMPEPNSNGIGFTVDHQITDVSLQSSNTITDIDADIKYITRIDRYEFLINQT